MNNNILVSICCITYNHEKFIRKAIESFLNQKTTFKYEIIIRDDASTDRTAEIIKEYEEKYPDIIKPIYEKVNGSVRGVKRAFNVTFEKAVGKYIAVCEGDDFWNDESKLQKQYDYMESNEDCSLYVHDSLKLNMKNNQLSDYNSDAHFYYLNKKKGSMKLNAGEMMLIDLCANFATASMFFRKIDVIDFPDFYYEAPVGDMPLKFMTAIKGYVFYDNYKMCTYRMNAGNSAMDKWKKQSIVEKENRLKRFIDLINSMNEYTDYKYDNEMQKVLMNYNINMLLIKQEYKELFNSKDLFKMYKQRYNDRLAVKFFIKKNFPNLAKKISILRGRK